jgi:dTDP-glucose pyrophosphorylase/predicted transcriptional regulator
MLDWHETLVNPENTLEQVIQVINASALQIALVVNKDNTLLGTITDGDVRRGLLNDKNLSCKVIDIMNENPITITTNFSILQARAVLNQHSINQVPVVDHENKITGLHTRQSINTANKKPNPVFLMAGGFGKRLRPLTDNCPKPLLKVGSRPILETILESFIEHGFHDFYISTHYLHEKITEYFGDGSKWGVSINYVYENSPLGTAGALSLLPETDHPIIMMNGDLLTKVNFKQLLDYHDAHNSTATMCVRRHEYQIPYGVVESTGNKIEKIVEKPINSFFINAGIYIISSKLKNLVPENSYVDMPDLIQDQINNNQEVTLFPIHEYWLDIGKMPDYNRAQLDFQNSNETLNNLRVSGSSHD